MSSTRHAVDWEIPGTMIGDRGPFRGTYFVDAPTPLAAWDEVERRNSIDPDVPGGRHDGEIIVRAYAAEDVVEVHAAARERGEWA